MESRGGFHLLHELEIAGTKLIRSAIITEVSVLTPGVKPAEAFARVCWVGESERSSAAGDSSDRSAAGEVVLGPQRIVRHGIGQVLGVR